MDPKAHEEAASPDGATGRGPRSGLDRVPPEGRPAGHAAACTWSRRGEGDLSTAQRCYEQRERSPVLVTELWL